MHEHNSQKNGSAQHNMRDFIAGAETLQQQAERKSGGAAIPGLQQAAVHFQQDPLL